jgi:flagellum-specific peptidoglycan hydrolase FlgJ
MNATESLFLQNTVLAASKADREAGIPACITLAQAILESRWGQSALARQANNYFGVKANDAAKPEQYIEFETKEFVHGREVEEMAKFARYPSPIDSFKAHANLLSMALRYRPAMAVKGDPEQFAQQLQACGYSTNPNYAATLMELVREFDLSQYNAGVTSASPAAPAKGEPV